MKKQLKLLNWKIALETKTTVVHDLIVDGNSSEEQFRDRNAQPSQQSEDALKIEDQNDELNNSLERDPNAEVEEDTPNQQNKQINPPANSPDIREVEEFKAAEEGQK